MKYITLTLIALFCTQTVFAGFLDTEYSWYESSINNLQKSGIVSGQGDGNFRPDWLITRAEILKIFMGAAKTPLSQSSEQCFPDVATDQWYSQYICKAKELSIAQGFEDGKFRPNDTVTYLEALAFGMRSFGIAPPPDSSKNWYLAYQKIADTNHILATHSYTLSTKIMRGKAAELVENLQKYQTSPSVLSYGSKGCSVTGKTLPAQNTIMIDGMARKYNLYVPGGYSSSKQYNLVVALHGRTNSNDMVQGYMGLQGRTGGWGNAGTVQSDTIVAYPAGVSVAGGYSWTDYSNIKFFDAILEQLSDNYCISRDQVYIVGHSLGAWFSNKLACVRGDVLRGMTAVAGPGYSGNCTGPVASLLFHNQKDQLVSYTSGKNAEAIRKTVNQCSATVSKEVTIGSLKCKEWQNCSTGNPVVWCEGYSTYQNDPHSWPIWGGGWILDFFKKLEQITALKNPLL